MTKTLLGIILIGVLITGCDKVYFETSGYKTRNVIIVIIDGPRFSETWGDPTHRHIPRLSNELSEVGNMYTNFYNRGPTYTLAGHTAITTGHYQEIDNSGAELPNFPSVFQHWIQTHSQDTLSAWLITSKDKLEVLSDCRDPLWAGKYNPSKNCGNSGLGSGVREDMVTFEKAIDILSSQHPRVVLIHFREPDYAAHAGSWSNYLSGIEASDEYLFGLWNFIETNPFYKGSTTLFMTNDHGRHLDGVSTGFTSHGDDCEGCRHINLFAYGPDFKRGCMIEIERDQVDIPATIAVLLNFEIPDCEGEVMTELFK